MRFGGPARAEQIKVLRGAGRGGPVPDHADRGGRATFTAQVAKGTPGPAQIQIRLGNPATGPVIGTATVPSTGDVYRYTSTSTGLTGGHGIHDVYLVFTGDLRIASFSLN